MGGFSWGNGRAPQSGRKSLFGGKRLQNTEQPDYSRYSAEDLCSQFKSENWKLLSDEEKIALFQEIENREAVAHNREPAKVIQAFGGNLGGYNNITHVIKIRLTDNQFEDLDTIFHEGEHANQSRSSNKDVNFSENDKKLIMLEDTISSDGRNDHYHYYTSLYSVMTSELDANNVALQKVLSFKEEFKDEEKYLAYLSSRQKEYEELAADIENKREEKKKALLETAECAYIRRELTEKEFEKIKDNIINNFNYDSCEARTVEINEVLKNYDLSDKREIMNISLDTDSVETASTNEEPILDRYQIIDAQEIKNINDSGENFWNHHGNTKEDYMKLASKLPEIQKELDAGKTFDEIKENPDLHDALIAYYSDDKMIRVIQDKNGSYQFEDDGRHRVIAAQEFGYKIPVNVVNSQQPEITNYYNEVRNKSAQEDADVKENIRAKEKVEVEVKEEERNGEAEAIEDSREEKTEAEEEEASGEKGTETEEEEDSGEEEENSEEEETEEKEDPEEETETEVEDDSKEENSIMLEDMDNDMADIRSEKDNSIVIDDLEEADYTDINSKDNSDSKDNSNDNSDSNDNSNDNSDSNDNGMDI